MEFTCVNICADYSQIFVHSQDLFAKIQKHISSCPLDIFSGMFQQN